MSNIRSIRSAAAPPAPPSINTAGPRGIAYPRAFTPSAPGLYQPTPAGQMQSPYGQTSPEIAARRLDPNNLQSQVAPWVQESRYPIIAGANLTLARVSSVFRMALTGYRQLYVDMLDELIEMDPHAYGVVAKRCLAVANAKVTVQPAKLPPDASEEDKSRAAEIADFAGNAIDKIPQLRQHLASLAWGVYYGCQAAETIWGLDQKNRWIPRELVMIHSRRLSYPDPWRWDLYVWDQGAVIGAPYGQVQLPPGIFGWKIEDYPGKFIVHSPQVRGDYPVREGIGRQIAYWLAIKHVAARAAPIYLDRFANPWLDVTYKTDNEDGKHRKATTKDIQDAERFAQVGAFKGAAHSDAVQLDVKSPDGGTGGRPKVTFEQWINICNAEVSKAALGGTLSTDVGSTGGNRALGQTQRKDQLAFFQYDASALAGSFDSGLLYWMTHLNFPGEEHLCPTMSILVEDDPDPGELATRAVALANVGYPVDADALEELVGIPIADMENPETRVLRPVQAVAPNAMFAAPAFFNNPMKSPEEYEAEKQAELDQQMQMHREKLGAMQDDMDDTEDDANDARSQLDAAKSSTPKSAKPASPQASAKPAAKPSRRRGPK